MNYPLHLGITEAGGFVTGSVKSAIGLGSLLLDGIGDTIRVSLSDDPVKEVKIGNEILKSLIEVIDKVISENNIETRQIAAIGITNQRETFVIFDKYSGKP